MMGGSVTVSTGSECYPPCSACSRDITVSGSDYMYRGTGDYSTGNTFIVSGTGPCYEATLHEPPPPKPKKRGKVSFDHKKFSGKKRGWQK